MVHPYQQQKQLLLPPPNNQLPRPTQPSKSMSMPTQLNPNPDNKATQPVYNNEVARYPTYPINAVELKGVQLRSRKALQGPTITEVNDVPEEEAEKESSFPNQFLSKPVQKEVPQTKFDFANELCNVNIKIPLLQAIKDIPVYNKTVRELCTRKQKKKEDPKTVQVIGQLVDLMLGNLTIPKYLDPGSHVIKRCVPEDDIFDILHACHIEPCRGHFATQPTTQNILTVGYYWPTIHKDCKRYVYHCDKCQRMGRLTCSDEMPLHPQLSIEAFEKWGLDFVGPINPPSRRKQYIVVCTYYVTKWVEVVTLKRARDTKVVDFLYSEIFTRFGVPREITTDQGPQFTFELIAALVKEYEIRHWNSTPYHP
ncbi:uncharacterized protein LOC131874421 [Cryptomeria japonica]|uniref:uncharacterized protein LOC131874421 n=1 Tax=Cryptomeria japonica TaxID=3369 RepID=UPI0027DAABDB|nr:uncharacterized protein LOC131874421 [Cryptomeria japonica]